MKAALHLTWLQITEDMFALDEVQVLLHVETCILSCDETKEIRNVICCVICSLYVISNEPHDEKTCFLHMSLVVRKPVFGVSDQVRHKPSCTITEDG